MIFSSFLADDHRPLVLDTSVLINLHACAYGEAVLTAIANDIVISVVVAAELQHETSHRNGEHSLLDDLISRGKLTIVGMTEAEYDLFGTLSGGARSLDDGEAATIAIAANRGFRAIIDERKGRARAADLMGGEEPAWSLDLLRHPGVVLGLGEKLAAEVVYLALRDGRMRIPADRTGDVVDLITLNRALECICLPNFKQLLQDAQQGAAQQAGIASRPLSR